MRKQRGFTLLELLIVVGIISILLMILYGAFARAKVHIKRARCLSNMRQVLVALHNYSAANGGKLPPANPWNARPAAGTTPALNEFLVGQGYGVLECPADEGDTPGGETSRFASSGSSYSYQSGSSTAVSGVVGSVAWQEEPMGYMSVDERRIRDALSYEGSGPETVADPDSRSRDITQQEIRDVAVPRIMVALQSLQGKSGFNIDASPLAYYYRIATTPNGDGSTNPPPPAPPYPNLKWKDQVDGSGQPLPIAQRTQSKWSSGNPWGRSTYNYDYWKRASKKVVSLGGDGSLAYNVPGTNGTSAGDPYPKKGMGFWHQYPYVKDHLSAADQSNPTRWGVKVHAGFLDGHAEPIVVHKYYTDSAGVKQCPIHGSSCQQIDRDDHDYY